MEKIELRNEKIDEELLRLINERAKLALSILKFKKENQLPVFDPDREKRILELLQLKNPGPHEKLRQAANRYIGDRQGGTVIACQAIRDLLYSSK